MADEFTVEKVGKEDVSFGISTFSRTSRLSSSSTVTITEINASLVPVVSIVTDIGSVSTVQDMIDYMTFERHIGINLPWEVGGGPKFVLMQPKHDIEILAAYWTVDREYTTQNAESNYRLISLYKYDVSGDAETLLAQIDLSAQAATIAKYTTVQFTLEADPTMADHADGDYLFVRVDSNEAAEGSPLHYLPPSLVEVYYKYTE